MTEHSPAERLVINSIDSEQSLIPATPPEQYKVYSQRWVTLIALFIVLFINGTSYIFYTPIIIYTQKVYGVPLLALNSIYMIYMVMYVVGSFGLSTTIIEKHGVGSSVICSPGGYWNHILPHWRSHANTNQPSLLVDHPIIYLLRAFTASAI